MVDVHITRRGQRLYHLSQIWGQILPEPYLLFSKMAYSGAEADFELDHAHKIQLPDHGHRHSGPQPFKKEEIRQSI